MACMAALILLPYAARLGCLAAASLLSASWLYAARNLLTGAPRLAAALPCVILHCAAPWLLFHRVPPRGTPSPSEPSPEIITIGLAEFALVWLSNFKVLAWVCNRGPLVRPWSRLQFTAILLAPISPALDEAPAGTHAPQQGQQVGGTAELVLAFAGKVGLLAGCVALYLLRPPPLACEVLYTLGLYTLLSFTMDGPAALSSALLGFKVAPHFDSPWRAASLSEFWSRRWDLVASNCLRWLAYEPIMEGQLVRPQATQRQRSTHAFTAKQRQHRLAATATCFAVSGLLHEVQFVYLVGHTSGGLMLAFFVLQIPLMLAERWLGAALRHRGWLPGTVLCSAGTLTTLLLLAHWTFWHAMGKHGVMQAAIDTLMSLTGREASFG